MEQPVILSAVRTPVGKFMGGLSPLSAPELGAKVIAEAVRRAGIEPKQVDEVIMGNVVQAGLGQNPARQSALKGGLDPRVAAMTINKVCGSGLKAVGLAAQGVTLGESEIVVAGGMESMSNCPYLLQDARTGYRIGNAEMFDSMITDGLWDVYENFHMGMTGELVAEKYGISRQEQDQFAFDSHRKAVHAIKSCFFGEQILPIEIPQKKGDPIIIKTRRIPARRHVARSPGQAKARLQKRRHGNRRQRPRNKRRRRRVNRHHRKQCRAPGQKAHGPNRRASRQRRRTKMGNDGPRRSRRKTAAKNRLGSR